MDFAIGSGVVFYLALYVLRWHLSSSGLVLLYPSFSQNRAMASAECELSIQGDSHLKVQSDCLLNSFFEMLHRLTPTQRMQRRGFDKLLHRLRINTRVLSQRPANGLINEEFF
jgi:hypothetical protein